jgi:hypothetical protein
LEDDQADQSSRGLLTLSASFEEAYKKLVGRFEWEDVLPMLAIGKKNEPVASLTPAVIT